MRNVIQLFSNSLGTEELAAIKKVYKSKWLGYGNISKKFEGEFASSVSSKYSLGLTCATAGLFLSMDILGIGSGDEVILPSVTFVGCANAILKSGAKPVFADVDPVTLNILPSEISRLKNKKTKAVMILHYGGQVSDILEIKKAMGSKLYLIEDSANSIHSKHGEKYCGTFGDLGVFSFDAMKVLVCGDGGMMTIQKKELLERAIKYRYLGQSSSRLSGFNASSSFKNWWEVDAEVPGNRYLINDVTSAVGLVQLRKLSKFIKRRKEVWNNYQEELRSVQLISLPPEPAKNTTSSYYLYWIKTRTEEQRNDLAVTLKENNIYSSFRYYPLHLIPMYRHKSRLKNSEVISKTTLNLPLHQNLGDRDIEKIVRVIKNWSKKY